MPAERDGFPVQWWRTAAQKARPRRWRSHGTGRARLRAARTAVTAATALAIAVTGGPALASSQSVRRAARLTYYVSATGNDSAAGTSPATAWRTLARATTAVLRPGTRLLLAGGQTFTGPLTFTRADAGNARRPVRVGSYGKGRATIAAPGGSGIIIYNTAGINISRLIIHGKSQNSTSPGDGIDIYNGRYHNVRLNHISISHVDVSGFSEGILIGGGHGASGFRNVRISYSSLHDNVNDGLRTYGKVFRPARPRYANVHVTVSHVRAYHNLGDPTQALHNTGSGIVLGNVRRATVTRSVAFGNGGLGKAPSNGPVGIWAYDASHVVFKHSLAYNNKSNDPVDGGGFDFDMNTSHSTMEYNLSYNNAGYGYLIYTRLTNSLARGNVIRFNISSGDTKTNGWLGGIQLNGRVIGARVYQNTVVMPHRTTTVPGAALLLGKGLVGATIRNNIFVTYQPSEIIHSRRTYSRSAVLLQGNDYYSAGGGWQVNWGVNTYYSLASWRAGTGQELLSGKAVGFAVTPGLTGPVLGLHVTRAGAGGHGFLLTATSALRYKGLDLLRLFGINPGRVDYSGKHVSSKSLNVGAQ